MTDIAPLGYLGVLGGMGPGATADFYLKLISATAASTDQEHVATIIRSVPQIPDRSAAISQKAESPLPALSRGIRELISSGAKAIAIPCNTAHFWYDDLVAISTVPVFHIVDTVRERLEANAHAGPVGLLATAGTIEGKIYQNRLAGQSGYQVLVPEQEDQKSLVSPGIAAVKAGDLSAGTDLLSKAARRLQERGAGSAIMACTEIPIVLGPKSDVRMPLIDATDALARHCVEWWKTSNMARVDGLHSSIATDSIR